MAVCLALLAVNDASSCGKSVTLFRVEVAKLSGKSFWWKIDVIFFALD